MVARAPDEDFLTPLFTSVSTPKQFQCRTFSHRRLSKLLFIYLRDLSPTALLSPFLEPITFAGILQETFSFIILYILYNATKALNIIPRLNVEKVNLDKYVILIN